jgi:predicted nucleotidyltransferase component of viral defense system
MIGKVFCEQAELLIRILPLIGREKDFALKGGSAINFFIRNLPRLSVDIDLTYLPIDERNETMERISGSLERIKGSIEKAIPGARIVPKFISNTQNIRALTVERNGPTVKIEPNLVIRGTVFPSRIMSLRKEAQDIFEMSATANVLSFADLYGGKICAALDRQHPRDFFDLKLLLQNEGITEHVRKAFIIYLISHPRPMIELLNPNLKHIETVFETEFRGMTSWEVTLEELLQTRTTVIKTINDQLTEKERCFILSIKKVTPEWDLIDLKGIRDLPAVKWKLINIRRMDENKRRMAIDKLKKQLKL